MNYVYEENKTMNMPPSGSGKIPLSSPIIIAIPNKTPVNEASSIDGDEITYLGFSMGPTFMPGDVLRIERGIRIGRGDVIVFREPGGDRYIIHRVIAIITCGFLTRGDHNLVPDQYVVDPTLVLGKVVTRCRNAQVVPVRDGMKGMIKGLFIYIVQTLIQLTAPVTRPVYRLFSQHTIPGRFLFYFFSLQPIVLVKEGKPEILLYLNGHNAGIRAGSDRPWQIRSIFRLFIDPNQLPAFEVIVRQALESSSRRGR